MSEIVNKERKKLKPYPFINRLCDPYYWLLLYRQSEDVFITEIPLSEGETEEERLVAEGSILVTFNNNNIKDYKLHCNCCDNDIDVPVEKLPIGLWGNLDVGFEIFRKCPICKKGKLKTYTKGYLVEGLSIEECNKLKETYNLR